MSAEYHVALGNVGLILQAGGYERRLNNQFAAKLATSGLSSEDRLGEQVLLLDSWKGGEGHLIHESDTPDRYRKGIGIDGYSEEGAVALGPYLSAIQSTAFDELTVACAGNGKLWYGTGNGSVYSWDGTTLTLIQATGIAGGVRSLMWYIDALYMGNGTNGNIAKWDGTTWTANYCVVTAFAAGTVQGVRAMAIHYQDGVIKPYFAATVSNYSIVGQIVAGATTAPNTATAYAFVEKRIDVLLPLKGQLVAVGVDTTDGRSRVYEGDNSATIGWEYKALIEGSTPRVGAVFNGKVYLGDTLNGTIWRWDGDDLTQIHQLATPSSAYTAELRGMAVWQGGLWFSIIDANGTVGLLRFDGNQSWHQPAYGLTGTLPSGLAVYQNKLHVLSSATGASKLYATDGTFAAAGQVESGLIDANLGGAQKLWLGVTIAHSALVSPQTVQVQYQLDNAGSWVTIGTSSTVGATTATLPFPSPVSAARIAFKILMTGTGGSSTPLKVYSLDGNYLAADGSLREWSVSVRLEGTTARKLELVDGSDEPLTGEELSEAIWALVDAEKPVAWLDIDDQMYTVHIKGYSEGLAPSFPQIAAGTIGWDLVGKIELLEVD